MFGKRAHFTLAGILFENCIKKIFQLFKTIIDLQAHIFQQRKCKIRTYFVLCQHGDENQQQQQQQNTQQLCKCCGTSAK